MIRSCVAAVLMLLGATRITGAVPVLMISIDGRPDPGRAHEGPVAKRYRRYAELQSIP
jgi:hypothetical protein